MYARMYLCMLVWTHYVHDSSLPLSDKDCSDDVVHVCMHESVLFLLWRCSPGCNWSTDNESNMGKKHQTLGRNPWCTHINMTSSRFIVGDMGETSDPDEDVLGELMVDDSGYASGGNRWRRYYRHEFGETQSLPNFSPRQSPYPTPPATPFRCVCVCVCVITAVCRGCKGHLQGTLVFERERECVCV